MAMKQIFTFRSCREWCSTLPVFLLLVAVIIAGNAEQIHARLLNVGELIWHDYFTLRADIPIPDCDPNPDIEAELKKLEAETDGLDELEELFETEEFDRESALKSLQNSLQLCKKNIA